jgi:hypothetical protein
MMRALAVSLTLAFSPGAGSALARPTSRTPVYFVVSPQGLNVEEGHSNRLVVEPSTLVVFPHRGWSIVGLRWQDWGSPKAEAAGTSVEATCEPNCAHGPRANAPAGSFTRSPARILLRDLGRWHGHLVYRCFTAVAPSSVPTFESSCRHPEPR